MYERDHPDRQAGPPETAHRTGPRRASPWLAVAAALACLVAAGSFGTSRLAAQSGPSVRIELERPSVEVGEEFDAFVYIEGAEDLAGFNLALSYDELALSYVDVEIGTAFLESGGRTVLPLGPNERPGRVEIGAVTLPGSGQAGANGAGDLAIFTFRGLSAGETTLGLSGIRLVDTEGAQTEPEGEGATLTIGTPVTPTPPPPTQAPMQPGAYLPWLGRRAN